jgi:hypothetical protein
VYTVESEWQNTLEPWKTDSYSLSMSFLVLQAAFDELKVSLEVEEVE